MAERKPQWPEAGDLVIATIKQVMDYGAYAKLDEYNKRGLLHVSEISSSRIRNIRYYVREKRHVDHIITPPKYRLEVEAENYKRAEDVIQKAADGVISSMVKVGGQGSFKREK
jgi:translation initiation factor 2 alpha subunit (eIF-2alpha)